MFFPPDLPITERLDDLRAAIAQHQVVVVAGETGSGKSTQLPKLCMEMGRTMIGHTQPRRIAARSIAERVAEELGTEVGKTVGYAVRFTDRVGPETVVKLMTDGILLAEIQRDRLMKTYDTIIIDEAHERSLNIDFLLGYLKQLLPRRPDLKVIITSATIDTEKFAEHFAGQDGAPAPIITVSGRTYPVEVRYRPLEDEHNDEPLDQVQGICEAVQELWKSDSADVLVFCSGEREINEAVDALGDLKLAGTEVVPLYGRLSAAEQHRVFAKHSARRIVVATNVAETSLTVPGIRSVIDAGTARISRYSHRTKVQRLPIEAISQASANQRSGRCGRLGPGICIRLYSEEDFNSRAEFTEPEIQRTNLASVILQMAGLGLGSAEDFPFVDPPEARTIRDGIALLHELDAVDPDEEGTSKWLTGIGRDLSRLPVDPRMGRMLVEGAHEGRLAELLVIVAGLSLQDPRERPSDRQEAAAQAHARFNHPTSDFLSLLSLWEYVVAKRKELSSNAFRRMCHREFIHHNRTREWIDLERQLQRACKDLKLANNTAVRVSDLTQAMSDSIHRALLAGLLSHVGVKDQREDKKRPRGQRQVKSAAFFRGARNSEFVIAKGSTLSKNPPNWVMAAELVETNRLYARMVARIDPGWLEDLASHLIKRRIDEPWWEVERGSAVTTERISLYGLPIVGGRRVQLGRVNPEMARELFIEHALVDREWEDPPDFLVSNAEVIAQVEAVGARARADVLADRKVLVDFYDKRLPDHAMSVAHFNRWWKKEGPKNPETFAIDAQDLVRDDHEAPSADDFPDHWVLPDGTLPITYEFDHASPLDGITVHLPVESLGSIDPEHFLWQVPGYRTELLEALLRGIPKDLRKELVPIPETVAQIRNQLDPRGLPLLEQLQQAVRASTGVHIPVDVFAPNELPRHLRPTFHVVDKAGETLAGGKDLELIRARLTRDARASLQKTRHPLERSNVVEWSFGSLPRTVDAAVNGMNVTAYPGLFDDGSSASIRLFGSPAEQATHHWEGVRRLLWLQTTSPVKALDRVLSNRAKLTIAASSVQSKAEWYSDAICCALDQSIARAGGPPWQQARFQALTRFHRSTFPETLADVADQLDEILAAAAHLQREIDSMISPALGDVIQDATEHRDRLLYAGVLTGFGVSRHTSLERYLQAIRFRLGVAGEKPERDRSRMATCRKLEAEHAQLVAQLGPRSELEDVGWLLEEFRVSSFAQHLGTSGKVSEARIRRTLSELV